LLGASLTSPPRRRRRRRGGAVAAAGVTVLGVPASALSPVFGVASAVLLGQAAASDATALLARGVPPLAAAAAPSPSPA